MASIWTVLITRLPDGAECRTNGIGLTEPKRLRRLFGSHSGSEQARDCLMTPNEMDRLAELVVSKLLDSPSDAEINLRVPGMKSTFRGLLPGIPRVGDVLWHPLRRNSKARPFRVQHVEWFSAGLDSRVEVTLETIADETPLSPRPDPHGLHA